MRFALPTLALVTVASAAPQVPDKPVNFYARLFRESDDCTTGTTSAYVGSRGACVNISVPGSGSALVVVGEAAKYYLAGWTGPDCTGAVVLVETNPGVCTSLGGTDVQSWSNDLRVFG
ncbi:uncharacterized protein J7T54_001341 [Emericellopsis cladophorae]|uniref:Uncharacterized protein n=1 Tax=Emericellopsis cladophorae TaxID=2686198 RepID=A0A9P9Y2T9_9HYPO|nr:uncharacterized protein J7T54_001341 [Emericellopsis cladophorae]KAI6782484.1 hypothetical protein J7T54_001341 [Emericellopsis cladophorae]